MHCHGCARKVEKHISKLEGNKYTSLLDQNPTFFISSSIFLIIAPCIGH